MDNTFLVANTPQLDISNNAGASVTEMTVRGEWNSELRTAAGHALRACFAENPRALIVNLAELSDPSGVSASTWRTGHRYAASRQSRITMILCAAPASVLHRVQGTPSGRAIGIAATVDDARFRVGQRGWPSCRKLDLPTDFGSARRARNLVADACHELRLPRLLNPAQLIMSELATNAVLHARTDLRAAVSVRGNVLHLAVRDWHPGLPAVVDPFSYPPATFITHGAGLRFVQAIAHAWGALPCRTGKVVWATLAINAAG